MTEDLFSHSAKASTQDPPKSNVPDMSVSDLAGALKKTLEQSYGRIRIRGELAGLKLAASGHLYGDIKDENANINIICWRGNMNKLSIKPEEGMDVIITGKVSSYPKSSRYQIIIDSMELAGAGALLKMLEERRKKLAAEGLFDAARKKPLPFIPKTIGVITSPTGAVIRDIMHRLKDRYPSHVIVWPVSVQGKGADEQITRAIDGFNAGDNVSFPKPDLIIVARGGGSLEDLMAFNEENVVRAVANSVIPIISAVGHETDTTLIDFASDLRAPTPTGAAEMAVPVRTQLIAQVNDDSARLFNAARRLLESKLNVLETWKAKLGSPAQILDTKVQQIDHLGDQLNGALKQNLASKENTYTRVKTALKPPTHQMTHLKQKLDHQLAAIKTLAAQNIKDKKQQIDYSTSQINNALKQNLALKENTYMRVKTAIKPPSHQIMQLSQKLDHHVIAMHKSAPSIVKDKNQRLDGLTRMLESLSFKRVLERGYTAIENANGRIITSKNVAKEQEGLTILFGNDEKLRVKVDK